MTAKAQRDVRASVQTISLNPVQDTPENSVISLWILRILVVLKADRRFVTRYGFEDNQLAVWLGLSEFMSEDAGDDFGDSQEPNPAHIRAALAKKHRQKA